MLLATTLTGLVAATPPIVMWHGMGDCCCFPFSMGAVSDTIKSVLGTNTSIYSIMIDGSPEADEVAGFLSNANDQVDFVCNQLRSDPMYANGFHAIGFSQGSQFLRAVAQRCAGLKFLTLITMGGQHMGVASIPNCVSPNSTLCELVNDLLDLGAYNSLVQPRVIQAQYFKDPLDYSAYLAASVFLADINNERAGKNDTYRTALPNAVKRLVLVEFAQDTVVVPRESSLFGYYAPGSLSEIIPMKQQPLYTEDWIGIAAMDRQGRIDYLSCPSDHMQFTMQWLVDNIVVPYWK